MFRKIKNFLRRKKKLKKAGLREHINARKASGKKQRIYTNKNGEKFAVERYTEWEQNGSGLFTINVTKHGDKLPYAGGMVGVEAKNNRVRIDSIGLYETDSIGSGRNFLGVFLDECKQLGNKYFKGQDYEIQLTPREPLRKYYLESGFKEDKGKTIMIMKVKKGK